MSEQTTLTAARADEPIGRGTKEHGNGGKRNIGVSVTAIIAVVLAALILFADTPRMVTGTLVIALTLVLMLLRIPIGVTMVSASILGLWSLAGKGALVGSLQEITFGSFASWSLSVIPMFILMGIAMGKSGLTSAAYDVARKWLGRMPGGLAVATNFAGAGLAAGSGSSIGITYAIGRVAIPEMIRSGYKSSLATGSVAMAGTLGQVIPPSVMLVIYAGVAEVPVGPQLMAGIIPGIILAFAFGAVIVLWATLKPSVAPRADVQVSWPDRFKSLVQLVPLVIIVAVVVGGIYAGIFTATEAGAYGAFVTIVFGIVAIARSKRSGKAVGAFLKESLVEAVSATASVFLLLVGVQLLTRVMAMSGVAQGLSDYIVHLGLSKIGFLFVLILIYLFLGAFIDELAMMLLTIPIFLAPLAALDVDLIWFGIFLIILVEIGLVAPPIGVLSFIVHGIAESSTRGMGVKIGIGDVYRGVMPFVTVALLFLVALIFVPEIATWLPSLSKAQ